jgi:hypothetical protein
MEFFELFRLIKSLVTIIEPTRIKITKTAIAIALTLIFFELMVTPPYYLKLILQWCAALLIYFSHNAIIILI